MKKTDKDDHIEDPNYHFDFGGTGSLGNHRRADGGQKYQQPRKNTKQYVDDKAFYPWVFQLVHESGPAGMTMGDLARYGKFRKWWQKDVRKHWGEKMRLIWCYGLVTVNFDLEGSNIENVRLVSPLYVKMIFEDADNQWRHNTLLRKLKRLDFMPQPDEDEK